MLSNVQAVNGLASVGPVSKHVATRWYDRGDGHATFVSALPHGLDGNGTIVVSGSGLYDGSYVKTAYTVVDAVTVTLSNKNVAGNTCGRWD